MAQPARNYEESQEFWKPATLPRHDAEETQVAGQVCENCGTDFVMGSRFCHVCGADRHANLGSSPTGIQEWFDFASLREALGQSNGSLVTLFLGVACLIAAILTGFLYAANTLMDWQAIQIWRIEWLLAATAVFLVGLLLKKSK